MELVVYLDASVADWMLDPAPSLSKPAEVRELEDVLTALGLEIRAQNPGVQDPELRRIFTAELPSTAEAETAAQRLLDCSGVEGAYAKPAASLP